MARLTPPKAGDKAKAASFLWSTILLGVIFAGLHIREWFGLIDEGVRLFQNPWGSPLFGATFFSITGLHLLHVIGGVVGIAVIARDFARGTTNCRACGNRRALLALRGLGLDVCRAACLPLESFTLAASFGGRMTMANSKKSGNTIAKYLPVYFSLLAIAVLEVFLAYQHFSTGLCWPFCLRWPLAAELWPCAISCIWHRKRRGLFLTLIPAVVFVLLMMNMIWSDSFRLLRMRPFGH